MNCKSLGPGRCAAITRLARLRPQGVTDRILRSRLALYRGDGLFRPGVTSWLRQDILEILIWFELLCQKATPDDLSWGRDKTEQRLDVLVKRAGGDEEFKRQLKPLYASVDEVRAWLLNEAVAEAVLRRELALRHAAANETEPVGLTEEQVKEEMRPYLDELWFEAGVRISDPHLQSILAPHRPE